MVHEWLMAPLKTNYNSDTNEAEYFLDEVRLNDYVGKKCRLVFSGKRQCLHCGKEIKKTFQQGYCFPCTQRLAACDLCVVRPTLCHYVKGTCREMAWGEKHCMIPHRLYIANTSELKVGLSRDYYVKRRWVDQGATQGLSLLRVQTREQAGILEESVMRFMKDKTNWRKMLQNHSAPMDLLQEKEKVLALMEDFFDEYAGRFGEESVEILDDEAVTEVRYPVLEYPQKVSSFDFDKEAVLEGDLMGLKGQYFIFDKGVVVNVRKFAGYFMKLEVQL